MPRPSGYDADTLVADVIGLLDALGIDRVALVAHDWSALIGFDLCLRHPERVSSYVAIAVPAPYIRMTPKLAGAMMRAMPHLWFQWVIATPGLGPRLLSGGRQRLAYWLLAIVRGRDDPRRRRRGLRGRTAGAGEGAGGFEALPARDPPRLHERSARDLSRPGPAHPDACAVRCG